MIRVSSIFSQMLQLFSRSEFERAVVDTGPSPMPVGSFVGGKFVAMLFFHLGRAQSLREICGGLAPARANCNVAGEGDRGGRSRRSREGKLTDGRPGLAKLILVST